MSGSCHSYGMSDKEPQTVEEAIELNALGPRRVQRADESVDQHSLEQQIKADQYLKAKTAASIPSRGLRFTRLQSPGAGF